MCLIIKRDPDFEIPFEKFKSAVTVNPDGYGLSFPEDGKLVTVRSPDKPDPEKLYRFVNEDLKDRDLLVHLRFTTAGATNLRNAHPFPILEKTTDGVDLRMAHNGTLHKWKVKADKEESDTRAFVKGFVRPLFKRLAKGLSPEELLTDQFTKELLEDQLTTASVLTFLDSEGNSLICNPTGNGGKQDDGWYYSNTYSFKENHRQPKTGTTNYTPPSGGTSNTGGTSTKIYPEYSSVSRSTNIFKFSKMYNIHPDQLVQMSDESITMAAQNPSTAELLIKELIFELHLKSSSISLGGTP